MNFLIVLPFIAFFAGVIFITLGVPAITYVTNRIYANDEIKKSEENIIIALNNVEYTEIASQLEPTNVSAVGYEIPGEESCIHTIEDGSQYIDDESLKLKRQIGFTVHG